MAVYSDEKIDFVQWKSRASSDKMPYAHYHNKHELYYLEKGRTKYFIGNKIFLLEPGDIVFVPKGVFHQTDGGDSTESVERFLLIFDDDFAGEECRKHIEELSESNHVRFRRDMMYTFSNIFRKIESEDQTRSEDYREMERIYLKELLILISRHRIRDDTVRLSQSYSIIQDAATYISNNYNQDLSLSFLSSKFAMSPSHFSKQFKSVTGIGLNEYINISRISAAEQLLIKTKLPITEIATRCGFNDSNYFAAVFKRLKGITPKKYSSLRNGHSAF